MDADYDTKFEEMKKYIPFLEDMISSLENSRNTSNPRQAQLNKIKSLRDLLLDKKKRMKMDNLLKCEQVLINLHAKVNKQKETLPGIQKATRPSMESHRDKPDLSTARNKLRTVIASIIKDPETLPEIARSNDINMDCSPGGKEPALFHRRPNRSPSRKSPDRSSESNTKRNYTRVLVSPEPEDNKLWSRNENSLSSSLYSRRSPLQSPRKSSNSYKRERKKYYKQTSQNRKIKKDFNITLKVPEDSLQSLNTSDILSRIINCDDKDVDIDALSELRKQILGELKQTGANEDISELILKSYKNKRNKQKKDIEEGELSDSESEAIDRIYGSLTVLENSSKDQDKHQESLEKDKQSRKIQIRFVLNSEPNKICSSNSKQPVLIDPSDFDVETYAESKDTYAIAEIKKETKGQENAVEHCSNIQNDNLIGVDENRTENKVLCERVNQQKVEEVLKLNEENSEKDCPTLKSNSFDNKNTSQFKPKFYTPIVIGDDCEKSEKENCTEINTEEIRAVEEKCGKIKNNPETTKEHKINHDKDNNVKMRLFSCDNEKDDIVKSTVMKPLQDELSRDEAVKDSTQSILKSHIINTKKQEKSDEIQIPLLNDPTEPLPTMQDAVSQIDILQALKNEILGESISLPCSDTSTPSLHQPKITKVASANKFISKKKISIENYKQKTSSTKTSLFVKSPSTHSNNDNDSAKKQSLKLTEKECERFNFISKLALDSSDDDEKEKSTYVDNTYTDLAPESPDIDVSNDLEKFSPVIIPTEPVMSSVTSSNRITDTQARRTLLSPPTHNTQTFSPSHKVDNSVDRNMQDLQLNKIPITNIEKNHLRQSVLDPRVKKSSPSSHVMNLDRTPRINSNLTSNITSNARYAEMTPSYQPFDDIPTSKHVYAPALPFENRGDMENSVKEMYNDARESCRDIRNLRSDGFSDQDLYTRNWEYSKDNAEIDDTIDNYRPNSNDSTNTYEYNRYRSDRRDSYKTNFHSIKDSYSYGRANYASTPNNPYLRSEYPTTPNHPFGRSDCPTTPVHHFGRSDPPSTPNHPFGRSDPPSTPNHPFGRSDHPMTPSHPFGQNEYSLNSTFLRHEKPSTPVHSFGRMDNSANAHPSFDRYDRSVVNPPGRPECLMNSQVPFNRMEIPVTPNHPFGRSDYISTHSATNARKDSRLDPRLNRHQDYEKYNSNLDNRYRSRYDNYVESQRTNDYKQRRDRLYSSPRSEYLYNRQREHSIGRSISNDRDARDNETNCVELTSISHSEGRRSVGRSFPGTDKFRMSRSMSISRDNANVDNKLFVKSHAGRSFTIDTSVNSTFQQFLGEKGLVDSHFDARRQRAASVGRSLARETTVRENLIQEPHVRKLSVHESYVTKDSNKRRDFKRASSVGRDVLSHNEQRSFEDIKEDFKSFKTSFICTEKNRKPQSEKRYSDSKYVSHKRNECDNYKKNTNQTSSKYYIPKKNLRDPRLRRENDSYSKGRNDYKERRFSHERKDYGIIYSNDNIAKGTILKATSSVKNYKIPKIKRREIVNPDSDSKTETDECVRNERSKETGKEKKDNKSDSKSIPTRRTKSEKNKSSLNENYEQIRSKKSTQDNGHKISSKNKKRVLILDSDSENESNVSDSMKLEQKNSSDVVKSSSVISIDQIKINLKKDESFEISSFSLDDLDIFPDNNSSDPVIDNINALIADLDNDIEAPTTVNSKYSRDISLKHGPDVDSVNNDSQKTDDNDTLNVINEYINDDTNSSVNVPANSESTKKLLANETECRTNVDGKALENLKDSLKDNSAHHNSTKQPPLKGEISMTHPHDDTYHGITNVKEGLDKKIITSEALQQHNDDKNEIEVKPETSIRSTISHGEFQTKNCEQKKIENLTIENGESLEKTDMKVSVHTIVSTTEMKHRSNEAKVNTCDFSLSEHDEKFIDSTTSHDIENKGNSPKQCIEVNLPDSTDEISESNIKPDFNSVVKPTENIENLEANSTSNTQKTDPLDSFLSVLQDKSKIKELLNMLDDKSNDNSKIKMKLEKLSKIMCEEEDFNEVQLDSKKLDEKDIQQETNTIKLSYSSQTNIDQVTTKNPEKQHQNESKESELDNVTREDESRNVQNNEICDKNETVQDNTLTVDSLTQKTDNDNESVKESGQNKVSDIPKSKKLNKKGKKSKKYAPKGVLKPKQVTRSEPINSGKTVSKKNELDRLQDDIREMSYADDILKNTGIRTCRIAKLVDNTNRADNKQNDKNENSAFDTEPRVMIEKVRDVEKKNTSEKSKVKICSKTKTKSKQVIYKCKKSTNKKVTKSSLVPKFKKSSDPYDFETDSNVDDISVKEDDKSLASLQNTSDSENDSGALSSHESSEISIDMKKKKRKRGWRWKSGIVDSKSKKKRLDSTKEIEKKVEICETRVNVFTPDLDCFTDKNYCFQRKVFSYTCRLCNYTGSEIVRHYKINHPHVEVPLSRLSQDIAKEAIEQCEQINISAIKNISSKKYVCRFCFLEFSTKKAPLEEFFWHVVGSHTGEYKEPCSECTDVTKCPFNVDIPLPPKNIKGQLIGYICGKCNYTQISLENLKTHVIERHNDEQTEVYTINFAVMTKKMITTWAKSASLMKNTNTTKGRVLRSTRSNQSTEKSEDQGDVAEHSEAESDKSYSAVSNAIPNSEPKEILCEVANRGLKIAFQTDDSIANEEKDKDVTLTRDINSPKTKDTDHFPVESNVITKTVDLEKTLNSTNDIIMSPHFKIKYNSGGTREWVCCIANNSHYASPMAISMKKHITKDHKNERWDGYCVFCKLIVTSQGKHNFKLCFEHYVDKHIDVLPVIEDIIEKPLILKLLDNPQNVGCPRPSIKVRPISELIHPDIALNSVTEDLDKTAKSVSPAILDIEKEQPLLPKIANVVSLGLTASEQSLPSPNYPEIRKEVLPCKIYKYEEWQASVMSKKHSVVLSTMLAPEKLVHLYKCAGRYCSFSTDSADNALMHFSTHERIGGEDAMLCAYCDFDCCGNTIDLVMHIAKTHGTCQFVCRFCFYRAIASQLVSVHMNRVHGDSSLVSVLKTTTPVRQTEDENSDILPRDVAVLYIECNLSDPDGICQFRTYTPNKFFDHLQQKHLSRTHFNCYECSYVADNPSDLVHHKKAHGLKLYQCTWCIHGADTESELLAHSSAKHPNKQPQAYIRMITNKEGSSALRVLPLAQFNKTTVLTTEIIPASVVNENPTRDAERSIDLEKLIRHTMLLSDTATIESTVNIQQTISDSTESQATLTPNVFDIPPLGVPPTDSSVHTQVSQTISQGNTNNNDSAQDIIYSLDSDDEDTKQEISVIDLSKEENITPPTETVVSAKDNELSAQKEPIVLLHKCEKCHLFYDNTEEFQNHLLQCLGYYRNRDICPFCKISSDGVINFVLHIQNCFNTDPRYEKNSAKIFVTKYNCGFCGGTSDILPDVKAHVKKIHHVTRMHVKRDEAVNSNVYYVVRDTDKEKPGTKRKLSSATISKQKRFRPQDIDQLPINAILEDLVYCSLCEFSTKVRINMVRHLQQHASQQPVANTAPVNPVPHLETNEKHFDKMINLASSSLVTRGLDKPSKHDSTPQFTSYLPPEIAQRYPKYIPERQRHACGAKNCSYISVDEAMLKYHWETLHAGSNDYHCVHCPPHQTLDKSRPLSALRIIAHLKMHDVNLYGCSMCPYYHNRKTAVEKHISETHSKKGAVIIIREDSSSQSVPATQVTTSLPTMDLKLWQCGLCQFSSMLRPAVIEHCAKIHGAKMQFKCSYCPFRTSAKENVTKHLNSSHAGRTPEIFYFYYREDSLPDEPDSTPRWMKQREKMPHAANYVAEVKKEAEPTPSQTSPAVDTPAPAVVDLNVVKQEATEDVTDIESLCRKFSPFCDSNGLKYKCPLCNAEFDDKECMQSHLYEELSYRKWACKICAYKAFHKRGLDDHMKAEHRINADPIELPKDNKVETWVSKLLEHQDNIIHKYKENLESQRIQISQKAPSPPLSNINESSDNELEAAFGPLGAACGMQYCCPKCDYKINEETAMQNHLETELTKIRWGCSNCSVNHQTYHQAQFHCKNVHTGQMARPVEAIRDPVLRAAWVAAVIKKQNNNMLRTSTNVNDKTENQEKSPEPDDSLLVVRFEAQQQQIEALESSGVPLTRLGSTNSCDDREESPESNNSLLVVRYEENMQAPESSSVSLKRKRSIYNCDDDSDDDKLVIDECSDERAHIKEKPNSDPVCPHCSYSTTYKSNLKIHILNKHFHLKIFSCGYCTYSNNVYHKMLTHYEEKHQNSPIKINRNEIPPQGSHVYHEERLLQHLANSSNPFICLECLEIYPEDQTSSHMHRNMKPEFVKFGSIVMKCPTCFRLFKDIINLKSHQICEHSDMKSSTPLVHRIYGCGYCPRQFKRLSDLKMHYPSQHKNLEFKYRICKPNEHRVCQEDIPKVSHVKRQNEDTTLLQQPKRVARKSTSKLPNKSVACKSTTKLPFNAESDQSDNEEFTHYGLKPDIDQYNDVTTMMPFCNTIMPFTVKKLREIIDINPKVVIKNGDDT